MLSDADKRAHYDRYGEDDGSQVIVIAALDCSIFFVGVMLVRLGCYS